MRSIESEIPTARSVRGRGFLDSITRVTIDHDAGDSGSDPLSLSLSGPSQLSVAALRPRRPGLASGSQAQAWDLGLRSGFESPDLDRPGRQPPQPQSGSNKHA